MIEFALLFALGFLTATLLGALIAPVIHRRIVRFAEDRLKATTPLTQQEVRAQKDAARAIYAAENVRTSQTLKRERDRAIALMLARETAEQQVRAVRSENEDLRVQLEEMNGDAGDLRSGIRLMEQHIDRLKTSLATLETDYTAKVEEAALLVRQLDRVSAELDELRARSAAEATHVDALHVRAGNLRDERESLRDEKRRDDERGRAMDLKLAQQEARVRQLESRLTTATALLADRETVIERRRADIDRLTAKSRDLAAELALAVRALRDAGIEVPAPRAASPPGESGEPKMVSSDVETPEAGLTVPGPDAIRAEAAQFFERLLAADPADDAALREDLLRIAAGMTALTAGLEGDASPIPALLAREELSGAGSSTLGARTRALLASAS